MNIYIRFEDTYGVADVFKICRGLDLDMGTEPHRVSENLHIRTGVTVYSIFKLQESTDIEYIRDNNIDVVLNVHDLDNVSGSLDELLTFEQVRDDIEDTELDLRHRGLNVVVKFVPVIYLAETLALYFLYECILDPVQVTHAVNIKRLHFLLADRAITRFRLINILKDMKYKVKRVRDYAVQLPVVPCLKTEFDKSRGNTIVLSLLFESFAEVVNVALTSVELEQFLKSINDFYKVQRWQSPKALKVGGEVLEIADLDELSRVVRMLKRAVKNNAEVS